MSIRKFLQNARQGEDEDEDKVENEGLLPSDSASDVNGNVEVNALQVPPVPALLDGELFQIVQIDRKKDTCVARCTLCVKYHTISGAPSSTGNFYNHIKKCHPNSIAKADKKREHAAALKKNSRLKAPKTSTKPDRVHPYFSGNRCVSQSQATEAISNLVLEQMLPLSIVESPSFVDLVATLTRGNAVEINTPGRKALVGHNEKKYLEMKEQIKKDFAKVNYACTTADIWTKRKKSYLGMTGHLIDPDTLERRGYALACKRITLSHTYDKIAENIHAVHKEYGLVGKVNHTTTDNASNFGKAFREYSGDLEETEEEAGNEGSEDSNDGDEGDCITSEDFTISRFVDDDDDGVVTLPPQMRCFSHTLNLVATTDVAIPANVSKMPAHLKAIPGILEYKDMKDAVFGERLSKLWMRLSKSTLAADECMDICGQMFCVPIYTRWTSEIRSVKKILSAKVKDVNNLLEKLKLPKLRASDIDFLTEWSSLMDPLAVAIDKLQGEKECYLGTVLPTIRSTYLQIKGKQVTVCQALKQLILEALEKRFPSFGGDDVLAAGNEQFVLAAMALPKFKVEWVPQEDRGRAIDLFTAECCKNRSAGASNPLDTDTNHEAVPSDEEDDQFFSVLGLSRRQPTSTCHTETEASIKIQILRYLEDGRKSKDMLKEYPVVKEVFLRLNTTLPSSAAVERLFCDGGRILTPDRNRLSDKNFEICLLLKSFKKNQAR